MSQENKNQEKFLPINLPCKKINKFLKDRKNDTGEKYGFIQREEHLRRNT